MYIFSQVIEVLYYLGKSVIENTLICVEILESCLFVFATLVEISGMLLLHAFRKIVEHFQMFCPLLWSWFYFLGLHIKGCIEGIISVLLKADAFLMLAVLLGLVALLRAYINFEKAKMDYDRQQARKYFRSLRTKRRTRRRFNH